MKKSILLLNLFVLFCVSIPASFAINTKYAVHTSAKDIEFKKEKALTWHEDNVDKSKFYFFNIKNDINWLKKRALGWHEDNVTKQKFYFLDANKEIDFKKKKALKWHERNSQ